MENKLDMMFFPYTDKSGREMEVGYKYKLWFEGGELVDVSNSHNTLLPKNSEVFSHFKIKYNGSI